VVPELHAVRAQRNLRREVGVTPGLERRRLVHRRLPLLVDDHDEEVRAAAQLPARRERLRLCLCISRSGTDRQRRRSRAGGAQSLQHLTARDVVARAHGPHPLRPIERPPHRCLESVGCVSLQNTLATTAAVERECDVRP
jgi:hypothetical protein